LCSFLDSDNDDKGKLFQDKEYVEYYTTCYDMCTQRTPYNWSDQLYSRHGVVIQDYLRESVLTRLEEQGKEGDIFLLKELQHKWENHKLMNKWMVKFFMYLDRYHVKHHTLDTLSEVGLKKFKAIIFDEIKTNATAIVLSMINQERNEVLVDRGLLKQVVGLYETMGLGELQTYTSDFEEQFLRSSREEYSRRSLAWIETDSTPDYLLKAEKALTAESARVKSYLNNSTEAKLLRVVEDELLLKCQKNLLEKSGSGCIALLSNQKYEDLARMFDLFNRLENGLQPMADLFKKFVEGQGFR